MINVTETFVPPLDEYLCELRRVWSTKWLTNRGELVRELEGKLKEFLGLRHLLAVSNGTIALEIAIRALGLCGEIITTPFSYVATTSSIVWENCTPMFVDIDSDYLTIDESKIEDRISENTTAILATHVFGYPCNVEVISSIAKKHNLRVIYDAAHCFGVTYGTDSILNWGDISTLSFHATKLFHTGEGGALVCNDQDLYDRIFYMHNFGHKGQEEFWGLGINGKMSELQAAMGLCVLRHFDEIISKRRNVCGHYDEQLVGSTVSRPSIRNTTRQNFSYYPVLFSSYDELDRVQRKLNSCDIFPRRYFYPSLNKLPYVRDTHCPVSEHVSARILCLPLYADLDLNSVEQIASLIKGEL